MNKMNKRGYEFKEKIYLQEPRLADSSNDWRYTTKPAIVRVPKEDYGEATLNYSISLSRVMMKYKEEKELKEKALEYTKNIRNNFNAIMEFAEKNGFRLVVIGGKSTDVDMTDPSNLPYWYVYSPAPTEYDLRYNSRFPHFIFIFIKDGLADSFTLSVETLSWEDGIVKKYCELILKEINEFKKSKEFYSINNKKIKRYVPEKPLEARWLSEGASPR